MEIDLNEPPIFDIDAIHHHDAEEDRDRGALVIEGVTIPPGFVAVGNGLLPADHLSTFGFGQHRLAKPAAEAFTRLREAAKVAGIDLTLTDSYRTFAQQEELKARKPDLAATPGKSVHGWGFAVDLSIGSPPKAFGQTVLAWLKANAPAIGWGMGRPADEPWHWVYRGPQGATPTNPSPGGVVTTPVSQPPEDNPELVIGSTAPAVRILQGLLGLTVSGAFDHATDIAVRTFQLANQLAVDGKVGPVTWQKLRAVTAPVGPKGVTLGSTGQNVDWIRRRLGVEVELGPLLDAAVKAFQGSHGLVVDGKIGPKTWAALIGTAPAMPSA